MIVKMFKPEFAEAIVAGRKTSTIRPIPRGRPPMVGQVISLRVWLGKPYRSKQREIKRALITEVERIYLGRFGIQIGPLGNSQYSWLSERMALEYSKKDGFKSLDALLEWFERVHGLPFAGLRITWSKVYVSK